MFSTLAFYEDDNDANGRQTELIINKANARVISIHWSNDSKETLKDCTRDSFSDFFAAASKGALL